MLRIIKQWRASAVNTSSRAAIPSIAFSSSHAYISFKHDRKTIGGNFSALNSLRYMHTEKQKQTSNKSPIDGLKNRRTEVDVELENLTKPRAMDALEMYSQRGDHEALNKLFNLKLFDDFGAAFQKCIRILGNQDLWDAFVRVVLHQDKCNNLQSIADWRAVISFMRKGVNADYAVKILTAYLQRGYRLNQNDMNDFATLFGNSQRIREMLGYLNVLYDNRHFPPPQVFKHFLTVCKNTNQRDIVFHLLEMMESTLGSCVIDDCYEICLELCKSVGDHEGIVRITDMMMNHGMRRHAVRITAQLHLGDFSGVMETIRDAHDSGINIGESNYFAVTEALSRAGHIDAVEEVLHGMLTRNSPHILTFSRVIALWQSIGQSCRADRVLLEMLEMGLEPSVQNFKCLLEVTEHMGQRANCEKCLSQLSAQGFFDSIVRLCGGVCLTTESLSHDIARKLIFDNFPKIMQQTQTQFPDAVFDGLVDIPAIPCHAHRSLFLKTFGEYLICCSRATRYRVPYEIKSELLKFITPRSLQAAEYHAQSTGLISFHYATEAKILDSLATIELIDKSKPRRGSNCNVPPLPWIVHYNNALSALNKAQNPNAVLSVLHLMKAQGVQPNHRSYTFILDVLKLSRNFTRIIELGAEEARRVVSSLDGTSKATMSMFGIIGLLSTSFHVALSDLESHLSQKDRKPETTEKKLDDIFVMLDAVRKCGFALPQTSIDRIVSLCIDIAEKRSQKHKDSEKIHQRIASLLEQPLVNGRPYSYRSLKKYLNMLHENREHAKFCSIFGMNSLYLLQTAIDVPLVLPLLNALAEERKPQVIVNVFAQITKWKNAISSSVGKNPEAWRIYLDAWVDVHKNAEPEEAEIAVDLMEQAIRFADFSGALSNVGIVTSIVKALTKAQKLLLAVGAFETMVSMISTSVKHCTQNNDAKAKGEIIDVLAKNFDNVKRICGDIEDLILEMQRNPHLQKDNVPLIEISDRFHQAKNVLYNLQ